MSAPGTTFSQVLKDLSDEAVKSLFSPSLADLLSLVDPDLLTGPHIRDVAKKTISIDALLQSREHRSVLLGSLSPSKLHELIDRCGLQGSLSLKAICQLPWQGTDLQGLLAFFGIDSEGPQNRVAEIQQSIARVDYGLFDHQRNLARRAWTALQQAPRTVVLHLPTGAGKTRTAMHLIARHLIEFEPSVVVWLAHSGELLDQAAHEFETAWSKLGNREVGLLRCWGSSSSDVLAIKDGLVVAGLQKMHSIRARDLQSFLRLADRAKLTVIDEAHIAAAPTYREIISGLYEKRAENRLLGLTATPGRSWSDIDADKALSGIFNEKKEMLEIPGYGDPVSYLIDQGFLARPKFRLLNTGPGLQLSPSDKMDLAQNLEISTSLLDRLGESTSRNVKIVSEAEELARHHSRIIVFAPSVDSAKAIAGVLLARGYNAAYVTGDLSPTDRRHAIDAFRSNRSGTMILCNFGVLTTGFDAPKTSAAIIARPTLSLVLYSQMVGRATRGIRAGGNAEAEIVTVVDPCLPAFGKIEEAFRNWEDVWNGSSS